MPSQRQTVLITLNHPMAMLLLNPGHQTQHADILAVDQLQW